MATDKGREALMADPLEKVLGKKINGTRVVPLVVKIAAIFTVFLLLSNFATNYINLMLNRGEQISLLNNLLIKDLKELYTFAGNQYDINQFQQNMESTVANLEEKGVSVLDGEKAVALGVRPDGDVFFQGSNLEKVDRFPDEDALDRMISDREGGTEQGSLYFDFAGNRYFGVFKYHPRWEVFVVRAEELGEFYAGSVRIFRNVSYIIVGLTIIVVVVGVFLVRYILRYVGNITQQIMKMQEEQRLGLVDMSSAPNDEVSYLGIAFNSLSHTVDNLMTIFKKFVARDVAQRAYDEKRIRLEGEPRELTILFSDIRSFTTMTETLGTDIIKLLNMHYDQAIRHIHEYRGDIGSIIGDALLAMFGLVGDKTTNKSLDAINASYRVHDVAASLRQEMHKRKEQIVQQRGGLTEPEERVYRAVLVEVGVGLDGGEVFYGNIGSDQRMTNTVIGDNVNSAARLEGLTRLYKVPVICSEYIKNEVEKEYADYYFMELDLIRVKGKTQGVRIYWPIQRDRIDDDMQADINLFQEGLRLYYEGDWKDALPKFEECKLPLSDVFKRRTQSGPAPDDWDGIWTMKEK
ncbi:MAG: adenylate/guanylate cyclase domain-containing protein [Spirochaetaceae bacterium]